MTSHSSPLDRVALGASVVVQDVGGATPLVRRLAELGVRPGALVTARHRTAGGGRVIEVSGARIALAKAVLSAIATQPRVASDRSDEACA